MLEYLLVYDYGGSNNRGARSDGSGGPSFTVRNSIFYNGGRGVGSMAAGDSVTVENCTVYNMVKSGYDSQGGAMSVTNSIAMETTEVDKDDFAGTISGNYNMSEDATAPGANSLHDKIPASQFASIAGGSEDLHLKTGSDAIDVGTSLSGSFTGDIDLDSRPIGSQWDIGADEINESCNESFAYWKSITIDRTKITNPAGTLPIAFDAVSSDQTADAGAGSLSWSHTVGAGSERLLVVGVSIRNDAGQTVTGVTYNSTALTYLNSVANGTNARVEMWYLKEADFPGTAGAYNVEVTLSASARVVAAAASFFNVDQTTPFGTFASNTGTSNPFPNPGVTVTNASGDVVVADGDGGVVVPRNMAGEGARRAKMVLDKDKVARRKLYDRLGWEPDASVTIG